MLFTPRLFVMAADKGIKIEIDVLNVMQTMAAYADMCYCAALNYWTMDNDVVDFPLTRADFHAWSAANQTEFGRIMAMAAEAITGRTMRELVEEQKEEREKGEDVKKKSRSNAITRLLKRFWSAIVG